MNGHVPAYELSTEQLRQRILQLEASEHVLTLKLKNVELERTVAQMNSEKEIAALRAENAELTKWKKRVLGQQRVQQEQQQQGSSSSNNNYKSAAAPIKREVHGSNQNQQQQQREQRGVNDVIPDLLTMALSKPNPRNGWNAELALQHGWKVDDLLAASKNHSKVCSSVRALTPFPVKTAAAAERQLFYFEVHVKTKCSWMNIGLAQPDFPLSGPFVGQKMCSFAVSNWGNLFLEKEEPEHLRANNIGWFHDGTVVGCGLLDLPEHGRRIFFTRDGALYREPVPLKARQTNCELYPTVSTFNAASIKANFGARPFRFNFNSLNYR